MAVLVFWTAPWSVAARAEPSPALQGRESIEADISTRSVAITPTFSGIEIIVFGAVRHSRQETPEAGLYDLVVVVEGAKGETTVRRKSNVGGMWVNTEWASFEAPAFYAIASTRPLASIASPAENGRLGIGFAHAPLALRASSHPLGERAAAEYREALIRLKQQEKLYVYEDNGVSFIGQSLFRTSIDLPANVPVGPLRARIVLFRDGQVLSQWQSAPVRLERAGIESFLYLLALRYPSLYGLLAVALAVAAGLLVSAIFRRT